MPVVRLRHVGPAPLEVGPLHGRLVKPGEEFDLNATLLPDVAAAKAWAEMGDDEPLNFADDAIHLGHANGQLLAWPTALWQVVTPAKAAAKTTTSNGE